MLDKFLSYGVNIANSAVSSVPSFGSKSALVFSLALLVESMFRYKMETNSRTCQTTIDVSRFNQSYLTWMNLMNGVQLATCLSAGSASSSYKAAGVIATMALSLHPTRSMMEHYLGPQLKLHNHPCEPPCEPIWADRPTFYTHFKFGMAVAGGVAKIIQSLAVGFLIQKALQGRVLEKIWIIVSSALLCLSCYNIASRREVSPR